jgi:hypothetical protein
MYGMVNRGLEDMVCKHHGESVWEEIKIKAGVDVEMFFGNDPYPDEITYKLVAAASQVLGRPAEEILERFGEHWVLHTAHDGYGDLMRAAGKSLPEFLERLPNFHTRVSMIFPELQPPRFVTTDLTDRSLKLHYLTKRPGLTHFVTGALKGLGKMFKTPVSVQLLESKAGGADHDVFLASWGSADIP